MGTNEMLQRAITYEQAILRNYRQYAVQADATEIGELFSQLAQDKTIQIEKLKTMLKKYCKP